MRACASVGCETFGNSEKQTEYFYLHLDSAIVSSTPRYIFWVFSSCLPQHGTYSGRQAGGSFITITLCTGHEISPSRSLERLSIRHS